MKKIFLLFLAITSLNFVVAQQKNEVTLRGVETIQSNGVVKGYYSFYKLDKKDRKNEYFKLLIYNLNLEVTHEKDISKPVNTRMVGGMHNGQNFMFVFNKLTKQNPSGEIELGFYDATASLIKTIESDSKDIWFNSKSRAALHTEGKIVGEIMSPINDFGFVSYFPAKHKGYKGQRSTVRMYDNQGKKLWEKMVGSKSAERSMETINVLYGDKDITVAKVSSYKSIWQYRNKKETIVTIDTKTGKVLNIETIKNDNGFLPEVMVRYDNANNQILAYGKLYGFNEKDRPDYSNALGFIINSYDKQGKTISEKFVEWKTNQEMKKNGFDDKGLIDGYSFMVHDIVGLKNGNKYLIAEQITKDAKTYKSGKLMIFEFNNENEPLKLSLFEKENVKTTITNVFSAGGKEYSTSFIATYFGVHNFSYMTISSDYQNFNVVYQSYNKGSENKNTRNTIGVLSHNLNGEIKQAEIKIESKPDVFRLYPAKPGYVAVFEYFEREKKIDFRLEKLDI